MSCAERKRFAESCGLLAKEQVGDNKQKISPFRKIGTGFLFIIPNLLFCQKTIAFSKTLSFGTRHRFRALFAFIFLVLFQNPLSLPTASQILRADDFVSPLRYLFL